MSYKPSPTKDNLLVCLTAAVVAGSLGCWEPRFPAVSPSPLQLLPEEGLDTAEDVVMVAEEEEFVADAEPCEEGDLCAPDLAAAMSTRARLRRSVLRSSAVIDFLEGEAITVDAETAAPEDLAIGDSEFCCTSSVVVVFTFSSLECNRPRASAGVNRTTLFGILTSDLHSTVGEIDSAVEQGG